MIIAFPISPVCSTPDVVIDIDRSLLTPCAWNMNCHDHIIVNIVCYNIFIHQKVGADFCRIIDCIPKILLHSICILQASRNKTAIFFFSYAKNDDTAIAICHGRISLPKTIRQAAFCFFDFQAVIFTIFVKFLYIKLFHKMAL